MENKTPKRFIMDIEQDFHTEIKTRAARHNIPMRLWVKRAISEAIKKEDAYEKTS